MSFLRAVNGVLVLCFFFLKEERANILALKLFLLRRLCSLRGKELYFCSLSNRIIVYKGQLVPEQLFRYFIDLCDSRFSKKKQP